MDVILRDSHFELMMKKRIPTDMTTPKQEYADEAWEGNAELLKQLETVRMTAAKNILLGTTRDLGKLRWG